MAEKKEAVEFINRLNTEVVGGDQLTAAGVLKGMDLPKQVGDKVDYYLQKAEEA
jgi:hypothetical protein